MACFSNTPLKMNTPAKINKSSKVQVVIRARPTLPKENGAQNCETVVDLNEPEGQVIVGLEKTFAFDACYSSDVTQEDIYKNVAQDIITQFSREADSNATILAYGQTGAGKTYTMLGNSSERKGIIQRSLEDIFR